MEADGGVKAGKAAEELGLRQVENLPFPLVLKKCTTQEQGEWDGNKFRHRKAVDSG
jgi:predicted DNA-binding protein (UPF0278 family)